MEKIMSPAGIGFLGIAIMLLLFATRMPVAFVMGVVGFVGFSVLTSVQGGLNMLSRSMYEVFVSYDLTTVAIPEMKRFGYRDRLAAGAVAAGGGLGMIMPPSVVLIIYGVLTEQSIGRLFVAGILPAFLLTGLFLCAIAVTCHRHPDYGPAAEHFSWSKRFKSLTGLIDTLIIFAVVLTGLFKGWFTPTEAASVGAFSVLVLGLVRRQLNWRLIFKSLEETLRTSCMILFLVAGAVVFGKFLAVTRIPFTTASYIGGLEIPALAVMAIIVLIYFLGGCFMDSLAMIMLTVPVFYPVVMNLGYDPIWFGVIIVLITEMGVITPPVGINVYVVYGVTTAMKQNISLESIFRGIYPFLVATIIGIAILFFIPQIVTFLPSLM
jgi:tripartite ATP-independent transporter DctM subunit